MHTVAHEPFLKKREDENAVKMEYIFLLVLTSSCNNPLWRGWKTAGSSTGAFPGYIIVKAKTFFSGSHQNNLKFLCNDIHVLFDYLIKDSNYCENLDYGYITTCCLQH